MNIEYIYMYTNVAILAPDAKLATAWTYRVLFAWPWMAETMELKLLYSDGAIMKDSTSMCAWVPALTLLAILCIVRPVKLERFFVQACAHFRSTQKHNPEAEDSHEYQQLPSLPPSSSVMRMKMIKTFKAEQGDITKVISYMDNFKFVERKQKGKSFKQVYDEDQDYVRWVQTHEAKLSFGYQLFSKYSQLRILM